LNKCIITRGLSATDESPVHYVFNNNNNNNNNNNVLPKGRWKYFIPLLIFGMYITNNVTRSFDLHKPPDEWRSSTTRSTDVVYWIILTTKCLWGLITRVGVLIKHGASILLTLNTYLTYNNLNRSPCGQIAKIILSLLGRLHRRRQNSPSWFLNPSIRFGW